MKAFKIIVITLTLFIMEVNAGKSEVIYLGGGCFWCIESVFERLKGVEKAVSGYMGGEMSNPTYQEVCSGKTGHAEVVKIEFDPQLVSLDQLLRVFFAVHDPTTPNRQGNDVGTQYRSAIFYTSDIQFETVNKYMEGLRKEGEFDRDIVTQVVKAGEFYEAEAYHQDYFRRNPNQPYCQIVVAPKVKKLEVNFLPLLK
ncbi:MAG: peptide-methionine (S)-S-oxide reductase MsrA [Breznakibacter sp.]